MHQVHCQVWILSVSLLLLAWLFDFMIHFSPRVPPLVNYGNEVYFDPVPTLGPLLQDSGLHQDSYLAPHTMQELVSMIKSVTGTSGEGPRRRLRVLGAGHSWSPIAKSDDLILTLFNYKGLVSVDLKTHQATFRGGTTLKEVNLVLEEHGLALPQLGSISEQTVAGAIATGTHGSGINFGNMATLVTRIELVTGEGEIVVLSQEDSDTDSFRAAQVSLGLLGVVTEVTFQCTPSFYLEETRSLLPLQDCLSLSRMEHLVSSADYVKLWVEVFSEACLVYTSNRTKEGPRDNPNPTAGLVLNVIFEMLIFGYSWIPSVVPAAMRSLFKYGDPLPPYNRVDTSFRIFNIPNYFPQHSESEVIVGIKDCAPAIKELKDYVEGESIPLNFITEVRFVRGDNIPLSPNYHRDSCHITLCIKNPSSSNKHRYLIGFFKRLARKGFKPRAHWGKIFDLSPEEVSLLYPEATKFLEIQKRYDPYQIFVNKILSETFNVTMIT